MKRYLAIASMLVLPLVAPLAASGDTVETYQFIENQSTLLQTGGFAGIHETYPVEGTFQLRINSAANTAAFETVNATYTTPGGAESLGQRFNMTGLTGTVITATTLRFIGDRTFGPGGPSFPVIINATLQGDQVHLTGGYDESPPVSDGFRYTLDATAQIPEPASLSLLAAATFGGLATRKRRNSK